MNWSLFVLSMQQQLLKMGMEFSAGNNNSKTNMEKYQESESSKTCDSSTTTEIWEFWWGDHVGTKLLDWRVPMLSSTMGCVYLLILFTTIMKEDQTSLSRRWIICRPCIPGGYLLTVGHFIFLEMLWYQNLTLEIKNLALEIKHQKPERSLNVQHLDVMAGGTRILQSSRKVIRHVQDALFFIRINFPTHFWLLFGSNIHQFFFYSQSYTFLLSYVPHSLLSCLDC